MPLAIAILLLHVHPDSGSGKPTVRVTTRLSVASDFASYFMKRDGWEYLKGDVSRQEFLASQNYGQLFSEIDDLPERVQPKILMVGDATAFGLKYPVEVNTVYNRSGLLQRFRRAGTVGGLLGILREEGFTHLLFNEPELTRYELFYGKYGWDEKKSVIPLINRLLQNESVRVVDHRLTGRGERIILLEISSAS